MLVCCSVLQCIAVCCSVLHWESLAYSIEVHVTLVLDELTMGVHKRVFVE